MIVTSAKKTFFAGGDLRDLSAPPPRPPSMSSTRHRRQRRLRRLETLGRPVVAVINGAALGGGYEIALACHHRVALDAPGTKIGLPRGHLRPAARRRRPGPHRAAARHRRRPAQGAAPGRQYAPQRAPEAGLVHEVAADRDDLLAAPGPSSTPTPRRRSPGTPRATASPAAPRPARSSPPTCPLPRQLRSSSPAPPTRRRATSWPPRSRAPRSTSTTRVIEARYFTELACGPAPRT